MILDLGIADRSGPFWRGEELSAGTILLAKLSVCAVAHMILLM